MSNLLHSLVFCEKNKLSRSDLTVSGYNPLVRHEFCECHRTASMHLLRGNTYFGTETKLCSVCERRWCIGIYACRIYLRGKALHSRLACRYYGFTVSGTVIVYVCNGFVKAVNGFNCHGVTQKFSTEIRCSRVTIVRRDSCL